MKLIESLIGRMRSSSYLPQYLIKAMLGDVTLWENIIWQLFKLFINKYEIVSNYPLINIFTNIQLTPRFEVQFTSKISGWMPGCLYSPSTPLSYSVNWFEHRTPPLSSKTICPVEACTEGSLTALRTIYQYIHDERYAHKEISSHFRCHRYPLNTLYSSLPHPLPANACSLSPRVAEPACKPPRER